MSKATEKDEDKGAKTVDKPGHIVASKDLKKVTEATQKAHEESQERKAEATETASETANEAAENMQSATTQDEKDRLANEALSGGLKTATAAPLPEHGHKPPTAGGEHRTAKDLRNHPVEKAKESARKSAEEFTDAMHADGTNLTPTQRKAMEDTKRELDRERQASPEPARGVEHSVGTERKAGLRTAMPESERKGLAKTS